MNPRYPVYVISKGRWESRLTSRALEAMRVPYRVVVEPQERDQYASAIDPEKILVLPFSNLGQGSIPARNWVWEHSISEGASRHWILDDNIRSFYRLTRNQKVRHGDGTFFRLIERWTDCYENVAMSGPHYFMFAPRRNRIPPFIFNTRVYSCILLSNAIPHRWRGRYNEDTDLSLRILKSGLCTGIFFAFTAEKMRTMTMTGGNTDQLYKDDGRYKMAKSLHDQHPDVVRVAKKWGRYQHHVDYRPFQRNEPRLRDDVELPDGRHDYGLRLVRVETQKDTSYKILEEVTA